MRLTSLAMLAMLAMLGCPSPPSSESASTTDTGGEESTSSSSSDLPTQAPADDTTTTTTGSACAAGDFEVLGQCYHQTEFPQIEDALSVAAADFDGDAVIDLAMVCKGASEYFALCFMTLDGSTVLKKDLDWLDSGDADVHAADFDADGVADMLVAEFYHFAVFSIVDGAVVERSSSFYVQGDDPSIDPFRFPALPIDVDQDGRAEVVAGRHGFFQGMQLWRFTPDQNAWSQTGAPLPLFGCGDLDGARVADLDGDGRPELLAIGSHNNCDANVDPGSQWNRVAVFTTDPNAGALVPFTDFAAELPAQRLDVGTFDGDGLPDVVVSSHKDVMTFRGHGDGTFDAPIPLPGLATFVGTGPHAGDFDGDGIDEMTVEQAGGSYNVLVGIPAPDGIALPESIRLVRLVADLNGDGHVDIVSLGLSDELSPVLSLSVP